MKLELDQTLRTSLYDYIDTKCLFRANPEVQYFPYVNKGSLIPSNISNNSMTWCFYLRNLTHNPILLRDVSFTIAQDIIKKASTGLEYQEIQLCGLESAAIPLLTGIQLAFLQAGIVVNAFTIRKERKPYGLCHLVDGIPNNSRVIVIDDMINSGNSLIKALEVCSYELGVEPAMNCYSIIGNELLSVMLWKNQYEIYKNYFFSKSEFSKKYDKNKYWLPKDCDKTVFKREM